MGCIPSSPEEMKAKMEAKAAEKMEAAAQTAMDLDVPTMDLEAATGEDLLEKAKEKVQEKVEEKIQEKVEEKIEEAVEAVVEKMAEEEPAADVVVEVEEEAASGEASKYEEFLTKMEEIKTSHPDNLCCKHLRRELFLSYTPEQQETLYRCCRTGVDNPDSGIGAYAMTPEDYVTFSKFFDPLIREYHKADPSAKHVTNWDASNVGDNGVLDITKLGLEEMSIRVRVGRNLQKFNLPGKMDQAERVKFEVSMLDAFAKLKADPEFGGEVYSLTPEFEGGAENPNKISDEKYNELVAAHVMFKDMAADPYLASAGIASDWPYGRGCYMTEQDGFKFIVWFGEEDCLRVMVMGKTSRIDFVFSRLKKLLDTIESIEGIEFATSEDYGYVTSCPSNLGTGMRASVHVRLPKLTADGTDAKAKEAVKKLAEEGVGAASIRGTGGEHTPIVDHTVDLSPKGRLFIEEAQIIASLYNVLEALLKIENADE